MTKREAVFRTLMSRLAALRQGAIVPFLFVLPFLFGLGAKLIRAKQWFGDYQAMACAGLKVQAHQPMYAVHLACPGMHASAFVYIPAVANIFATLEHLLSEPVVCALYAVLFFISLAALVVVPLRFAPGAWRDKLPFAVFIGQATVTWGNVAVLLHAAILGAALLLDTAPWLFVVAVACAAAVKPVFLTYLAVILLSDMPWLKRLGLMLSGAIAGLAPTFVFIATDPGTAYQWAQVLTHFVYDVTPGSGFYGWLGFLGVRGDTLLAQAMFLVYAGALALSALYIAYRLKLDGRARLWLGLGVAALLIPRIMSQDVFLLAPGLVIVAQRGALLATSRDAPAGKTSRTLLRHGPNIVWGLCALALMFGWIGRDRPVDSLALLGLSLYLIGLGATLAGEWATQAAKTRNALWSPLNGRAPVKSETQA